MTLATAIASAALLLAGCATPGDTKVTAQPIDGTTAGLGQASATPAISPNWWTTFGDETLDALVERAIAGNPSLKTAQARVRRAQADSDMAGAADKPHLDASAQVIRQRYSENGLVPPPIAGSTRDDALLQLSARWDIDLFGRDRAAYEAAVGTARAAQADAELARLLLAEQVVRTYFELGRLVEQRDVLQRSVGQRAEILSLIERRVHAGLDTAVELRQGEGAVPEARRDLQAVNERMAITRHALAMLSAQTPGAVQELSPRLGTVASIELPEALPADLLGRRPDVIAARWRIEAATRDMAAARAQFYPSVNLLAFAGLSTITLSQLTDGGSRQYGFGPALRLPLFDGGALRANYRGKAAQADAAIEAYNHAVLDAVRDAADQIASVQSVARQQQEQSQAQDAAESAYTLALQSYRAGLGSYLTVLGTETNVLAQRRLSTDLKARALVAQVSLIRALGGGYAHAAQP